MTDSPNTTDCYDGAILDLQGVQALLGIIAWAEDSMPYVLAGETRRVAFMLLEQTMGQALKTMGANNEEMERDKAGAAKAKAKPVAEPWKAGTSQEAITEATRKLAFELCAHAEAGNVYPDCRRALSNVEDARGDVRDIEKLIQAAFDSDTSLDDVTASTLLQQAKDKAGDVAMVLGKAADRLAKHADHAPA